MQPFRHAEYGQTICLEAERHLSPNAPRGNRQSVRREQAERGRAMARGDARPKCDRDSV